MVLVQGAKELGEKSGVVLAQEAALELGNAIVQPAPPRFTGGVDEEREDIRSPVRTAAVMGAGRGAP
ncbi:MAG TPA: hypothetical protein VF316_20220 [Polyangiaceae bacterium]